MKFINPKGQFGYLKKQRNREMLKTVVLFAVSLSLYFAGRIATGSNKNLLTIVAVLGCLPASQYAVRAILFVRAKGCSQQVYDKLSRVSEGISVKYDLYLTSYKKNFQLSQMAMKNKNLMGFTEDAGFDENAFYEHLKTMLLKNGYKDITVKVFSDLDKYTERLQTLRQSEMEDKQKLQEDVLQLMEDLSL